MAPGLVRDLGLLVQQREHGLDVDEPLPDLAIDHAEEVERHVELDQHGVDHDEIAHRMRAGHRRRAPASHMTSVMPAVKITAWPVLSTASEV